ncbi:endolytic transglycosylase MltG [Virgibacillus sp. C22-A2]|uniref:Endolytic murein transglycosylase n=1 Tax=Virgibacillus tibetensis TaxID=3042313 RepID=A0ABU6KAK2_9BACI|nr:endolytic transglycosylase MltG [Virgibacillus sp. C22-A2]
MSKKKKFINFRDNLIARSEEARTVRKIVAIIIISLVLIFLVGGISGYMYVKSALQPVDPENEEEVSVDIPIGSSTSTIATILEENGLIKDGRIFSFYIKFKNESDFQAGEYTFTTAMTIDELIESLQSGRVIAEPVHTITIPEGKTIEEMAAIYSEKLHFKKDDFLEKVNELSYIEQLMETYPTLLTEEILAPDIRTPLEGYLFAATYSFYEEEPSVEAVVEEMLKKTQTVVSNYQEEITAKEFTMHEAITFASLVEKEASTMEQRNKIAGVFYNRLADGMKLQTDPTVLYALGEHKDRVLYADLEIESPYNTYYIDALPIGPIANFAESSLEAVINPEDTDYMYFLHDNEGNIHYAETDEEHLRNREQYIN